MDKIGGKRMLAVILSAMLLITGMQIPAAATEGVRPSYSATPSDAVPEYDENAILPATPADAAKKPANIVQPMILDSTLVLNSARLLTTQASVPGFLTLELDIVEEGTGVSAIVVLDGRDVVAWGSFPQPLFTGINTVDLELQPGLTEGDYEINTLILQDSYNQNIYSKYMAYDDWPFSDDAVFSIISSVLPQVDYTLESISFKNPMLQVSEYLKANIRIGNIGSGISTVSLAFSRNDNNDKPWYANYNQNFSGKIKQGDNTIMVNTSHFEEGSYELVGIKLQGSDGDIFYDKEDDTNPWLFGDLEITVAGQLDPAPVITDARIKNATIQSPGTLDIEMDITVGNGGVDQVYLYLYNEDINDIETLVSLPSVPGDLGEILTPDQPAIQTGTYTFRFPLPSDMYPGIDYRIYDITIIDRAGRKQIYDYGGWFHNLPTVRITRADYALETSVLNPSLPAMLAAVPDGSEVLLDGVTSAIIPKALFTAVAGRNITVSVERWDVLSGLYALYIFNGKDIRTAAIKDVPIKFTFTYAAGADYGIVDETVYLLQFDGGGTLPCPITFQLPIASLLLPGDSYSSSAMYVSRLNGTDLLRGSVVSESADGLTEISFTNYSDFILSRTEPVYKSVSGGSGGSSGSSSSADAGTWIKDGTGWWYQFKNGTYPKATWKYLKGNWYYFEDNGYMATGWKILDGKWYWLDSETGKMTTDHWLSDRGSWYYLGENGEMKTGWQTYKDAYYYLSELAGESYGRMLKNERTPDDYDVNQDGVWVP